VREAEGRLVGAFEYRSDLYSAEAIARIASQLSTILRAAIADARRPIGRLPLVTASELDQLMRWGTGEKALIERTTVSRQFERQAEKTPQKAALTFEMQSLSYAQLNRQANQLARLLRNLGVGPGIVVGVCLERSIEMVIALLAVLKSGGAYLPLDPEFPVARLAFMLEDSDAKVVLISKDQTGSIVFSSGVQCFDPIDQHAALSQLDGANPDWMSDANDLAYVIYTSGSTGRPKGVAVPHSALVNFLCSMLRKPGFAESDVLAAVTTVSFDISALEIYLPLIVGGRVELISRATASDGLALADHLASSEATVLQATTASWRLLLEADWRPQRRFRAFCGGEALPRDVADALLTRVDELWNLYGPTETTIWSTVDRVLPTPAPITIGKPIANTEIYLLDAYGEPVSIGMSGELWIGGAGVALGYHNRPDLTVERFVPDRFSSRPDGRLYRTGDLARWDREGRIRHLGRLDQQVKIRGFRIELEEVEVALTSYPGVRQACVSTAGSDADAVLVAYFVHNGAAPTTSELRRHLRTRLPDYMLPALFVNIDEVPLTPNGKVDRRRLPDPFRSGMRARTSNDPLAPGAEQALADVWREILKTDNVGPSDNFFELGGHSLLSLRVAAAFKQRTGANLDPRAMFFQTLREVAMGVSRQLQG
jgi:amino acid adenylation domain-containing protein